MWSAEAAHISAPLAGHPQLPGTGQSSGCPDARGTTSEGSLPPSPGGRELSTGGRQGASQPRTRGATRVPWAYPVLVLDDVLPDGGQRGPLAVTGRTHSTAFVGLELTHWERTSASAWGPWPWSEASGPALLAKAGAVCTLSSLLSAATSLRAALERPPGRPGGQPAQRQQALWAGPESAKLGLRGPTARGPTWPHVKHGH